MCALPPTFKSFFIMNFDPPLLDLGPCRHKHMGHVEVRSLQSPGYYSSSSYQTSSDDENSPSHCFDPYYNMGKTPRFYASSYDSPRFYASSYDSPRLYDFKSPVHQTMSPLHTKKPTPSKSQCIIENTQSSPTTITIVGFDAPYRPPRQDLRYMHYQRQYQLAMGF